MHLQSEHIFLRAVEPSDATTLMIWENDEKFWHVSGTEIPFSMHAIQDYIENAQNFRQTGQLRLMICKKEDQKPIGCIDLYEADFKNRRAGVGILIADSEDKEKGYAFESLNLLIGYAKNVFDFHQLHCLIGMQNIASMKLFEKAGFKLVGKLKEWNKVGKAFEDVYLYQLIF